MAILGLVFAQCLIWSVESWAAEQTKPKAETRPSPSPNTVFLCRDGTQQIYTNTKLNNSCKAFVLGPLPAPPAQAATPGAPPPPAGTAQSPSTFPKVSETTQKARDTDRKRILEDEMGIEQKNLDLAKKELAQQETKALAEEKNYKKIIERLQPFKEKVTQHERNIQALRKEMLTLK